MKEIAQPAEGRKKAIIKAVIFLLFIIIAITVIRYTPVKHYLTAQALSGFLDSAGIWAPVVYMLFYAAGVCIFLPGTLFQLRRGKPA